MEAERIRQDNEFKVKADKETQTMLSDTNTALSLPPSLGHLNITLIMQ